MIIAATAINLITTMLLLYLEYERQTQFKSKIAELKAIREHFARDVAAQNKMAANYIGGSTGHHEWLLKELRQLIDKNKC